MRQYNGMTYTGALSRRDGTLCLYRETEREGRGRSFAWRKEAFL
jgi:hypothetical protein